MGRSFRTPVALLVGLLLAVATALVPVGAARAAGTATISGTVTSEVDHAPEPGVVVSAYAYDDLDQAWEIVDSALTDEAGHYSITGLAAGSYVVGFYDLPDHVWEFYDGARSADTAQPLSLADAEARPGIDASLEPAGAVSGTVTGPGAAPLGGIYVIAYRQDPDSGFWDSVGGNWTEPDGTYVVPGLPTGSYRLAFVDETGSYVDEYWDDASSLLDAAPVAVTAGSTTSGRDAVLALAGRITGTVTGPGDTPLQGVFVSAYRYVAGEDFWDYVDSIGTGADGGYDLAGLPSGTYRLGFDDFDGSHVGEYWDDEATLDAATDIPLAAGSTASGKDAELGVAGHVTGAVTGSTAGPLDEVEVSAYRHDPITEEWLYANATWTDSEGAYDLGGLPTGTYRLQFRDLGDGHLTEWWDDKPTLETANDILVTAGATVSDRDAVLATGSATSVPTAPVPAPTPSAAPTPAPTPTPTPTISNTARPRISGTPEVGTTLKLRKGTWAPASVTLRLQWLADGKRIRKATRARFTVTRAQLGKRLTVKVTAVLAGAPSVVVTTRPTAKIKA